VRDLLYAVSLESCAVSAIALAEELAGSEKAFVQKMNEKALELGLKDTHFTNTIGLHHDEHYTTARELAAIFAYAMDNELCRTILTAYSYRAVTNVHQNGITSYSTLLRDRFADKNVDTKLKSGHEVLGGKTGYTAKAAYCLATYSEDADGVPYLLITCGGNSSVSTVDDCIVMLQNYGTTAS
jgi:D-alanyl-D-alanine carboxypeptidase (penicillin-binding protein 5/6)